MQTFNVLSEPVRCRILEYLLDGEQPSGGISDTIGAEFDISQPAVSQHLKVLRDNNFASVRIDGARRLYSLNTAPLKDLDRWLDKFRKFWEPKLDALANEVERLKKEK